MPHAARLSGPLHHPRLVPVRASLTRAGTSTSGTPHHPCVSACICTPLPSVGASCNGSCPLLRPRTLPPPPSCRAAGSTWRGGCWRWQLPCRSAAPPWPRPCRSWTASYATHRQAHATSTGSGPQPRARASRGSPVGDHAVKRGSKRVAHGTKSQLHSGRQRPCLAVIYAGWRHVAGTATRLSAQHITQCYCYCRCFTGCHVHSCCPALPPQTPPDEGIMQLMALTALSVAAKHSEVCMPRLRQTTLLAAHASQPTSLTCHATHTHSGTSCICAWQPAYKGSLHLWHPPHPLFPRALRVLTTPTGTRFTASACCTRPCAG